MHKYQLKEGYRDGSVAPQDYETGKVFIGEIIHEYVEPTEFIEIMVEGGYIEEVTEDIELIKDIEHKKRGRPKVNV